MSPMTPMTDEDLLLDYARTRRPGALAALTERHWAHAYRLSLRTLGDAARAEDVAQEAFVHLVRHARRFEAGRPFLPWFRTLVMNAVRNEMRSKKTRERHEERFAKERPREERPLGEERLAAGEVLERLTSLPLDVRYPLVLHYFEGCSHEEVAATLGCPKGTASSRIRRGLEQLREALAGAGAVASVLPVGEVEAALGRAAAEKPAVPPAPGVALLEAAALAGAASVLPLALALKVATALVVVAAVSILTVATLRTDPERAVASAPPPGAVTSTTGTEASAPSAEVADPAGPSSLLRGESRDTASAAKAVRVLVVDASKRGVPGALVRVRKAVDMAVDAREERPLALRDAAARLDDGAKALAETTTDARGEARLDPAKLGAGRVVVVARRGVDEARSAPLDAASLGETTLVLRSPAAPAPGRGSIVGTILLGASPVCSRTVAVNLTMDVTRDGETTMHSVDGVVTTDERGQFAIHDLLPAEYAVSVEIPAWRAVSYRDHALVEEGHATSLRLAFEREPSPTVFRGRVVAAPGTTLPEGVFVTAHTPSGNGDRARVAELEGAGRGFRGTSRELGAHSVCVFALGRGAVSAPFVVGREPEVDLGDVAFGRGATVTGRLLGTEGRPLEGALVVLGDDRLAGLGQSDADGRFRIEGVARGRFTVGVADAASFHEALFTPYVVLRRQLAPCGAATVPEEGEVSLGDLVPSKPALAGRVVGPDGRARKGAGVTLRLPRGSRTIFTDGSGRFSFATLEPGAYTLHARQGELVSASLLPVEVAAVGVEVELPLVEGGKILGAVLGPRERLADLTVSVQRTVESGGGFGDSTSVGAKGRYELAGLLPGRYTVSVGSTVSKEVEVACGRTETCDLPLRDDVGSVIVRVRGVPERLGAARRYATAKRDGVLVARDSGQSEVSLREIPAGTVTVELLFIERGLDELGVTFSFVRERVLVSANEATAVELSWPDPAKGGKVEGKVKLAPSQKAWITARAAELSATVRASADGSFVLDGLPAGSYDLSVRREGVPEASSPTKVSIVEGKTATAGELP